MNRKRRVLGKMTCSSASNIMTRQTLHTTEVVDVEENDKEVNADEAIIVLGLEEYSETSDSEID